MNIADIVTLILSSGIAVVTLVYWIKILRALKQGKPVMSDW